MLFALIGNFGTWEVILILFVALMVFGPGKLPEVAKTIGKTMGEIKKYTSGVQKEFQDAINIEVNTNTNKEPLINTTKKTKEPVQVITKQEDAVTDQTVEGNHSEVADTNQILLPKEKDAQEITEAEAKPKTAD